MPVSLCWCLSGWYFLDSCLNLTLTSLSLAFGSKPSISKADLKGEVVPFLLRRCRGGEGGEGDGGVLWVLLLLPWPEGVGSGMCTPGFLSFCILWSQAFLFVAMSIQLLRCPFLSLLISWGSRIRRDLTMDLLLDISGLPEGLLLLHHAVSRGLGGLLFGPRTTLPTNLHCLIAIRLLTSGML